MEASAKSYHAVAGRQPRAGRQVLSAPDLRGGAGRTAGTCCRGKSTPASLKYDISTASTDGTRAGSGFEGKGNAIPAEMLPSEITFDGVRFHLAQAKTGTPNAVAANGQHIDLPSGSYNRVYVLAASADGDQKATFAAGGKRTDVNVEDWTGFIGQWDDRQWKVKDTAVPARDGQPAQTNHDDYSEMMDSPAGVSGISLPNNDKIRIFAVSVADESPGVTPTQPLCDVLGGTGNAMRSER